MKDDRHRVDIDDPFAKALGLATFCWARCEWDAVWCCERLRPGYVNTIEPQRKTAGKIGAELLDLVNAITDADLRAICLAPATEFRRLAGERNALLHGKPGTAKNGDQRLFRVGVEWSVNTVNELQTRLQPVRSC